VELKGTTMEKDFMTILICANGYASADKTYTKKPSGDIIKSKFLIGKYFKYVHVNVDNLDNILYLLINIEKLQKAFFIRGKVLFEDDVIVRDSKSDNPTIIDKPHHWVMLDCDDLPYPEDMDILTNPDEVIQWVKSKLPEPFHNAECVYRISSSQNIPQHIDVHPEKKLRTHLYFWCERKVSSDEWKRYFKQENAPVDLAVYTAVQPHLTANPQFKNMNNPITERVGKC
jgi:hypothetical protein